MGVIKMGNIVPRVGLKPTSHESWASVLPFHHVGSLMSAIYPHLPVYAAPCLRSGQTTTKSTYTCVFYIIYTIYNIFDIKWYINKEKTSSGLVLILSTYIYIIYKYIYIYIMYTMPSVPKIQFWQVLTD